jgi:hypothetical protein
MSKNCAGKMAYVTTDKAENIYWNVQQLRHRKQSTITPLLRYHSKETKH